tara:strand:+ start:185 stop:823 length:639 start_codon:yes stop_codon:yes gene_type:complete
MLRKERANTRESELIHSILLNTAIKISEPLHEALKVIGPFGIPIRTDQSLIHFLAKIIVGQQLSTRAASSIWRRLEIAINDSGSRIPEYFSGVNSGEMRLCGVSSNKIKALISIRMADKKGELCSKSLGLLDHAERSKKLLRLFGIGQWTCDMTSIFYYQSPDIWPISDVTVQRQFGRLIGQRKPETAIQQFVPYRTYLALAMYKIADSMPK